MYIKMKKVIQLKIKTLFLCMGLLLSNLCLADVYNVEIKVTVIQKTCDIYGVSGVNQPIEIKLNQGNPMFPNYINGDNYTTEIPYTLNCPGALNNAALKLKFDGSPDKFNGELLKTSDDNLGLRVRVDNNHLNIGEWHNFYYLNKPKLTVTPEVSNGSTLIKEGDIYASGVLSVEYQ
ncbi:fimbrial protein [Providencia rettgeri]|uniref:fimbrial protein n=1 Tax=Providencia rettgeri TaxID=587 RepID=UPI001E4324D1|nr:fimbrial protein [Providencia rettgeri]